MFTIRSFLIQRQEESAMGIRSGTCALLAHINGGLVVIDALVGRRSLLPLI